MTKTKSQLFPRLKEFGVMAGDLPPEQGVEQLKKVYQLLPRSLEAVLLYQLDFVYINQVDVVSFQDIEPLLNDQKNLVQLHVDCQAFEKTSFDKTNNLTLKVLCMDYVGGLQERLFEKLL